MLSWEEYIKKGIVRKTSLDVNMIKSLIKTSDDGLDFFKNSVIDDKNSCTLFKNYYDFLREICEAIAISRGYKIYQHEAITLFLKEVFNENDISFKFDKFRILRNGIHYYGKTIPKEETFKTISDIRIIIKTLKSKYLKQFV